MAYSDLKQTLSLSSSLMSKREKIKTSICLDLTINLADGSERHHRIARISVREMQMHVEYVLSNVNVTSVVATISKYPKL